MYTTCNLKSTLYKRRTRKDVHPIDTTVYREENGHDDSTDSLIIQQRREDDEIDQYEESRNGSPPMYYFHGLGLVLAGLPITHELQDTEILAELYERGKWSDWGPYIGAINNAEMDYGLDQDLIDQTDRFLGLPSTYWQNGPKMAPQSDHFF